MSRIPVNLVTGFLGVGKTSAIRHLLQQHPADETWAVLVNEYGEVGIDGALLADEDIVVHEVAGGCLCCIAAPAFTTGLNRLIRQHRPERILIEPSGLGHPAQVLATLTGPLYAQVLDVRATLCLLDARQLASPRHREHPNFQDQIHLCDVLVANKTDQYAPSDRRAFESFVLSLTPPKLKIGYLTYGRIDPGWLDLARSDLRHAAFPEAHAFLLETADHGGPESSERQQDWLLIEGQGDGYNRAGWIARLQQPVSLPVLRAVVDELSVERKKGLFQTEGGWMACNQAAWSAIAPPVDGLTRLELIDADRLDAAAIDQRLRELFDQPAATAGITTAS